ncbi:PEP-CTERM sorting domain-containing protein [Hahella sp. HN01]|uniref:PEP-CTERM sorting domain-containing protein n=1 Tax=Hahella sp. HN01 TaxID=2847262 RepID=UPI001C1E99ED|nr:PEP-CTERM sorting domain-containing protein [Hahella sp. HN01]
MSWRDTSAIRLLPGFNQEKRFKAHYLKPNPLLRITCHIGGVSMKPIRTYSVLPFLLLSIPSLSNAGVIEWKGPVNGAFSDASNWQGGVTPKSGDTAVFNTGGASPYTVTFNDSDATTIESVEVRNDQLTIENSFAIEKNLTIGGTGGENTSLTFNNGQILFQDNPSGHNPPLTSIKSSAGGSSEMVMNHSQLSWVNLAVEMEGKSSSIVMKDHSGIEGLYLQQRGGASLVVDNSSLSLSSAFYQDDGVALFTNGAYAGLSDSFIGGKFTAEGPDTRIYHGGYLSAGGELTYRDGAYAQAGMLAGGGTINIDGAGSQLEFNSIGLYDPYSPIEFSGEVNVTNGGVFGDLSTTGYSSGWISGHMKVNLSNGSFGAQFIDNNGTISGHGQMVGELKNKEGGRIESKGGSLALNGNYTQDSASVLSITIGDWMLSDDTAALAIDGTATLDGFVTVQLEDAFKPKLGDAFNLLSATSIVGEFSDFSFPGLSGGMGWAWEIIAGADYETLVLKVVANQVPVPEPGTLALFGLSASLILLRRRKPA